MIMKYNYELEMKILEEIYYIISQHMNSGKKIDINFLESIFNIIKNYKSLDKYVNKIIMDNSINNQACYSFLSKSISFNFDEIYKYLETFNQVFSKGENELYKYIFFTMIMLHETEHANQRKIKNYNTLESKIILGATGKEDKYLNIYNKIKEDKNNLKYFKYFPELLSYHSKYKRFYIFAPQERLANIKSEDLTIHLLEKFDTTYLIKYMILFYNIRCLKAYQKNLNPTMYYLKKVNPKCEEISEIERASEELDLDDRLILGLKLTKNEYKEKKKHIDEYLKG